MTCIVGLVAEGTMYLGGDSAATSGWDLTILHAPKVKQVGDLLIGVTGSTRHGQLLTQGFTPPLASDSDVYGWVCGPLVDAVRARFIEGGIAQKRNEQETAGSMAILVGVAGRLFTIWSDYGVTEAREPYCAVGCGEGFALGVLYATEGLPPRKRVQLALDAAERFSAGVRGPMTVLEMPAL